MLISYSVDWLLRPSNMLLPHIPAVFIVVIVFVYLHVFCG